MFVKKRLLSLFSAVLAAVVLCCSSFAASDTDELSAYLAECFEQYSSDIDMTGFVNKYGWDKAKTVDKITKAYYSHPEFFFVKNEFLYSVYNDKVQSLQFEYVFKKKDLEAARKLLDAEASKIVEGITDDMSDIDKALYVHDHIILQCRYDTSKNNYSAYNCLVDKSCVCQGYTLAYEYILNNLLGIECTAVYSNSQNHIWNYVKIGDNWYHVDLTQDDILDSYGGKSYDRYGCVLHDNFLMSDTRCKESSDLHRNWIIAGDLPAASDTSFDNAFWTDVTGALCFNDGSYYYMSYDGKDSSGKRITTLCRYDLASRNTKKLTRLKCSWYVTRSNSSPEVSDYGSRVYTTSFSCPAFVNGKIYFNSNKSVYSYNIRTKKLKKIYTLNKSEDQQIFGLTAAEGGLRIAYRKDLTYGEKYIRLEIKGKSN